MTLTVRLPPSVECQLAGFCEATGASKSQVVLNALQEWLAKPTQPQAHPLLVFADSATQAAPPAEWRGPYSKERLRELVRSSGGA